MESLRTPVVVPDDLGDYNRDAACPVLWRPDNNGQVHYYLLPVKRAAFTVTP